MRVLTRVKNGIKKGRHVLHHNWITSYSTVSGKQENVAHSCYGKIDVFQYWCHYYYYGTSSTGSSAFLYLVRSIT